MLTPKFGSALLKRGFTKGDTFAICLPNVPEYPIVYFGVAFIGGIVTSMNPQNSPREIAHQLRESSAKFIITTPQLAEKVKKVSTELGITNMLVLGQAVGFEPFSHFLQDDGSCFSDQMINPKRDTVALPYSSGTTGISKGVVLTHFNLVAAGCIAVSDRITLYDDDCTIMALVPFFHIYGQVIVMALGLRCGCRVVCLPQFEPEQFLKAMQDYRVSCVWLYSASYSMLVSSNYV